MVTVSKGGKQRGLNSYLLALALVCFLPVVMVSAVAVWHAGMAYMNTASTRLNDTARALANAIEGELAGRFATMDVLASSWVQHHADPMPLTERLFKEFSLQGEVSLVDARHTALLKAQSLARASAAEAAIYSGSRAVSNIVVENGEPMLSLGLPVRAKDGHEAAFVWSASPNQLIQTLQRGDRSLTDILVAVTDGNGRIVARSRDAERFIGQVAPDWPKLKALKTSAGQFDALTAEGDPVVLAYQTLQETPGWVVVVGEPVSTYTARWRDPIMALLVGALAAIGLALLVAVWLGQRILQPIRVLASRSDAIAEGRPSDALPVLPSAIREFETLRVSFEKAETALRMEKRRYRAIAEVGAIVIWRRNLADGVGTATGWEQLTGRPAGEVVSQAWADGIHPEDRPLTSAAWAKAMANSTPLDVEFRLKVRNERWLWVRSQGAPVTSELGEVVEWVGVIEDIDARKRDQARIAHLAHHDALTGLANRTLFRQRLAMAAKEAAGGTQAALLCLDLDRFKLVNDTLGHPIGDALLQAIAGRLRACAVGVDCIARVGGDEFAIIQTKSAQPEAAASLGYGIVEALCEPYDLDGNTVNIGASIGITMLGDLGANIDGYLKRADEALYRAKDLGRARVCFHEQDHLLAEMGRLIAKLADDEPKKPVRQQGRSR